MPSRPGETALEPPRWFTAALSGTPVATEHRALDRQLRRCLPRDVHFDAAAYPAATLDRARRWWLEMMRSEYQSTTVFLDMALQLRAAEAPLDLQSVAIRMAIDELRHAELCARVVETMGGEARQPSPPVTRSATSADCAPEEGVLRTVIYACCLSETVSAARLARGVADTADPFVREVFRQLLADERLHAQFGFNTLEAYRPYLDAQPAVRPALARYLRFAFATLERQIGARPPHPPALDDADRAIGLPDLADLPVTFQETMAIAVVPGLERFGIDAGAAWSDRSAGARSSDRGG